ncbi:MAG: Tn3 family transposase [Chloroflexi bacterium]|nr:Tn3 family transposase [Chloroflexota bacterium]
MPVQFLTEAERTRLSRFPPQIPPEDLITYFTLSAADLAVLAPHRGAAIRLGFALQLGALRYLGFCPDDLTAPPAAVRAFLEQQLGLLPDMAPIYGQRAQTRTDHLQEIHAYLGFRDATPADLRALTAWLVERALEHDAPTLLFQLAAERLSADKIVRPTVIRLERLVASAREQAQQVLAQRLAPLLTDARKALLDRLLVRDEGLGRTRLDWLRQGATANTPRAILAALERRAYLLDQGVDRWDLSALTPNRRTRLAQLGRRMTNQALQRAPPDRRYPLLAAVLVATLQDRTDEVIELFDRYLAYVSRCAERELAEFRRTSARATNEKVRLLRVLGAIVLDPEVTDPQLRSAIYAQVPPERLEAAVAECDRLIRPPDDTYFDFLAQRYGTLRAFAPALLAALPFRSGQPDDPLLEAVALLRQLNTEGRRKVPEDTDLRVVPARWQPYVQDERGHISRRYYELCVLCELRAALRAGNVWVEGSRRYANPASYLLPPARWEAERLEVCRQVQVPVDGRERLRQRDRELTEQLARLEATLPQQETVRLERGALVVPALRAEEQPPRLEAARQAIGDRLPRVDLPELLIEVDYWTHFTQHFSHAGGGEPRTPALQTHLYAALLAQACNLGLTAMAEIADLSYRQLAWCTTWYLRDDTLRPATAAIVNYQHHQPLSRSWGGGTLSSSDGQRFPAAIPNRHATALPRYFGYGRGLTFYSWTSDQFSQYGTKVIPATVRDATYVLDEILDNATELPILEHTTDTAGYTDLVFALFDLLGLQFAPRIRDLGDQRLYRLDRTPSYPHVDPLLRSTIDQDRILERWDDLLRVAGSLKLGWVTASLLIGKLQAVPRQNTLARALQEYGRLIKTIFILRYLDSTEYRRRIGGQLNKGEMLHALRRFLFFGNEGQLRRHQEEELANQAACLNLVTNAVITWNTVYMAASLEQLRTEGTPIEASVLPHLSPARFEHINPYGKYQFVLEGEERWQQLRPLRSIPADP